MVAHGAQALSLEETSSTGIRRNGCCSRKAEGPSGQTQSNTHPSKGRGEKSEEKEALKRERCAVHGGGILWEDRSVESVLQAMVDAKEFFLWIEESAFVAFLFACVRV